MGFAQILAIVLGSVGALLASLKANGVNTGPIGDIVAKDIQQIAGGEADYLAGQAVVVGTMSYNQKPGVIVVLEQGGAAYQTLFG